MSTTNSSYLMFVGSYTDFDILAHLPLNEKVGKGLYCFHFNNGEIKPLSVIPSLNPAVLSFHPSDPHTMYILEEGIHANGTISKLTYTYDSQENSNNNNSDTPCLHVSSHDAHHQQTNGKSLCYFKVDPVSLGYGIAINYWDGHIDVYTMNDDGSIAKLYKHIDGMSLTDGTCRQVIDREDHWKHRQVGPHAHSVHYYKQWVFVPDLGENCIHQFAWNPKENIIMKYQSRISLPENAGPRHMVFHPTLKVAYVSNELSSSITVLSIDDESDVNSDNCRLSIVQTIDTDKDMHDTDDIWRKNKVAEIGISNDGRFIYCSNRGYDTIAIFEVQLNDNGRLRPTEYVSTYGKTPRHFSITPDDEWLVGANQDSNNLVVFKRNRVTGGLRLVTKYESDTFGAPNYVLFMPYSDEELEDLEQEGNATTPTHATLLSSMYASKSRNTNSRVLQPLLFILMCLTLIFALALQLLA